MRSTKISILGSTGSIGVNTLKVVEHLGDVKVSALGAGQNMEVFAEQIIKFEPEIVSCKDDACANKLLELLHAVNFTKIPKIETGEDGLIKVATHEEADTIVSATVGAVGFVPTLRALEIGKTVALANKETLVMAGELMTKAAKENGAEILPVDSEHNAIHQCLKGEKMSEVKRLILTASGGPFREKSKKDIENATVKQALDHPTWDMGDKISIDSATLMNKGFEVIEAHWLFDIEVDDIGVIVHPQSVIHSMVEMLDGSIIAQLGVTDMKHAIQYALTYPNRKKGCFESLDFTKMSNLTFEEPDFGRFPNLELAYKALKKGGTTPAVLNASNEIAVQAFLDEKIKLNEISMINEKIVESHTPKNVDSLETVLDADEWARDKVKSFLNEKARAI